MKFKDIERGQKVIWKNKKSRYNPNNIKDIRPRGVVGFVASDCILVTFKYVVATGEWKTGAIVNTTFKANELHKLEFVDDYPQD